jgi:hypothetical protein
MSLQELYEHFDECCADEEVTIWNVIHLIIL